MNDFSSRHKFLRISLLGARCDIATADEMLGLVYQSIGERKKTLIANHNLHSLYLFHKMPDFRHFYEKADLIEIDSMPMIFWGKLLGQKLNRTHRITYLDYREKFWELALKHGWKIYHVGGHPDIMRKTQTAIEKRVPLRQFRLHSGFFDMNGVENSHLLADIVEFAPDVILVGMGMPRQEMWIDKNYHLLPNCAILPVGAAFDYEAGVQFEAPRIFGQLGLEWLARLIFNPKRLFYRYMVEPWTLFPYALSDLIKRIKLR